jgi:hypothetical protein
MVRSMEFFASTNLYVSEAADMAGLDLLAECIAPERKDNFVRRQIAD